MSTSRTLAASLACVLSTLAVLAAAPEARADDAAACGCDPVTLRIEHDTSEPAAGQDVLLERALDCATRPGARVRLTGHTSTRGSEEYNVSVGTRHAEAVATRLEALGVARDRMTVESRGESQPVCTAAGNKDCDARNRRVELAFECETAAAAPDSTPVVASPELPTLSADEVFEPGKPLIRDEARASLDAVVALLQAEPALRVEIAVHDDDQTEDLYGQKPTQARADAVRDYLVEHGIEASRLIARGYGESRPIDTNQTEAGRQRNRRIELVALP